MGLKNRAAGRTLTTTRRAFLTFSRDAWALPKVDSVLFMKPSVMSAMLMLDRFSPANMHGAEVTPYSYVDMSRLSPILPGSSRI